MSENEKGKEERTPVEIFKDAFAGMKGRQPTSDQELNEWLASSEGMKRRCLRPH
jgi:hypothetical protein